MALKRAISESAADYKLFDKLTKDLDVMAQGHSSKARKLADLAKAKNRMASRLGT